MLVSSINTSTNSRLDICSHIYTSIVIAISISSTISVNIHKVVMVLVFPVVSLVSALS